MFAAADSIMMAVQLKVRNGSLGPASAQCRPDILMHWFGHKPLCRGSWELEKVDFPPQCFPLGWDTALDVHGEGPQVRYPMTLRMSVRYSTKRYQRTSQGSTVPAQRAACPHAIIRFGMEQCGP